MNFQKYRHLITGEVLVKLSSTLPVEPPDSSSYFRRFNKVTGCLEKIQLCMGEVKKIDE